MQDIAIYGASGYGKEVAGHITYFNSYAIRKGGGEPLWNIIGFFDDGVEKGTAISHWGKVLGGMKEVNAYDKPLALVLAIGNQKTRKKVVENITNPHITYPNLIYPDVWYLDKSTVEIGMGNVICGATTFSCDVKIGNFNLLNGFVNVGHDVEIGDFNSIMPGVRISGEVHIGSENLLGVGSIILQQTKIGERVTIGAGGVVLTKPKNDSTYIGNPAKLLKY
jgi:sugar O-acyltransferase (sialic acid O-acetyltransferase NeuD family)